MGNEGPLVTVVTPSYNYGAFIGACMESVRVQTYSNIEHIVLDARSTDTSSSVIASYSGRYGLRSIRERDEGQADALNKGFAMANGSIFCWLNADDYWLHERVVRDAVDALDPAVDVVTGGGQYVDKDGRFLSPIDPPQPRIADELRYYDTLLQPATFWRRTVHAPLRVSYKYAFDWKLFLDMVLAGARFQSVDARWAAYRLHGKNKTTADPSERRAEIAEILGEQWGTESVQYRWARGIYWGFKASEALRLPVLKWGTCKINGAMKRLSGGRVCSS